MLRLLGSSSDLLYFHDCPPRPAELPESSPRYVVLSYNLVHKDGRTSSPLVLINWVPTCETSLLTLHASALLDFQSTVRPIDVAVALTYSLIPLSIG